MTEPTFKEELIAEIVKQEALIQEMDYPPNQEFRNPAGIMASIRRERLELLERLLEFEP